MAKNDQKDVQKLNCDLIGRLDLPVKGDYKVEVVKDFLVAYNTNMDMLIYNLTGTE